MLREHPQPRNNNKPTYPSVISFASLAYLLLPVQNLQQLALISLSIPLTWFYHNLIPIASSSIPCKEASLGSLASLCCSLVFFYDFSCCKCDCPCCCGHYLFGTSLWTILRFSWSALMNFEDCLIVQTYVCGIPFCLYCMFMSRSRITLTLQGCSATTECRNPSYELISLGLFFVPFFYSLYVCIHGAEADISAATPILDVHSITERDHEPEENYQGVYPISALCVSDGCSQYFSMVLSIKRFLMSSL